MKHFFSDISAFFLDALTSASTLTAAVLITLMLSGIVLSVLLLRTGFQMSVAPWQRIKWRRQWHALAKKEGWTSEHTRQLSGKRGRYSWRLAVLRNGKGYFNRSQIRPSQAIWQMRKLNHADRLFIVPKAEYLAKRRSISDDTQVADVPDLQQFSGALAGLATRESWAGAAVGWSVAGDHHADWVNEDLPAVHVGSAWFQARYVVLSNRAPLAWGMISPQSEALLAQVLAESSIKPEQFVAVLIEGQFSMRVDGNLTRATRAGRFCHLGLALTARLT